MGNSILIVCISSGLDFMMRSEEINFRLFDALFFCCFFSSIHNKYEFLTTMDDEKFSP